MLIPLTQLRDLGKISFSPFPRDEGFQGYLLCASKGCGFLSVQCLYKERVSLGSKKTKRCEDFVQFYMESTSQCYIFSIAIRITCNSVLLFIIVYLLKTSITDLIGYLTLVTMSRKTSSLILFPTTSAFSSKIPSRGCFLVNVFLTKFFSQCLMIENGSEWIGT